MRRGDASCEAHIGWDSRRAEPSVDNSDNGDARAFYRLMSMNCESL